MSGFLPTTAKEVKQRGFDSLDVILFTGDAYVDHPSFGVAVIARVLQAAGYRVAVVPQPNWQDDLRDFRKLGRPNLFFGVTSGNMDSMVNHYTAARRLRSNDAYTAGGGVGRRPDYATKVYTGILKELYPDVPVVIGGLEASLRRLAHYDYWRDRVVPSMLVESGADYLLYGMAERSVVEVAHAIAEGGDPRSVRQVAFMADKNMVFSLEEAVMMRSFEECVDDKDAFNENFRLMETESNKKHPKKLIEPYYEGFVVVNESFDVADEATTDAVFDLPYTRLPHPRYRGKGDIPAYEMIKNSVTLHRGCFGGCSFCAISAHQGKFVTSRSEGSVMREIDAIAATEGFKGVLSDLGGPSANMYRMGARDEALCERCSRPSCLWPAICRNLQNDHSALTDFYRRVAARDDIRHVFIGSGIRYDMIDERNRRDYLLQVIRHHTSGRLKVAPEHTSEKVLKYMRKPPFSLFERLSADFDAICAREGLKSELVPYFISSHPACTEEDMRGLWRRVRDMNLHIEPVQDFTPTPMTLSTAIYYTGRDPYTGEKVFVERDPERKKRQKEYFFGKKQQYGKKH